MKHWKHYFWPRLIAKLRARTSDEIEEERRLLYVAMIRSKDELDLIRPQRLFMYQQNGHDSGHVYASISRFIPKSIYHAFEAKHWGERPASRSAADRGRFSRRIDVASSVERMWR